MAHLPLAVDDESADHTETQPVIVGSDIEWVETFTKMRLFSRDECDSIINAGIERGTEDALVIDEATGGEEVDTDMRISRIAWLPYYDPEHRWIVDRIAGAALEAATELGVEITSFMEDLQVTQYAPGGHYAEHTDGPGRGVHGVMHRKLSVVIQLSPAGSYTGGHLRVGTTNATRSIGSATFFRSFQLHQAHAVRTGTRWSLVSWIGGHPFR